MRQRTRSELQAIHDYALDRMYLAEGVAIAFWGRPMCHASYTVRGELPGLIPDPPPIPPALRPLVEAHDHLDLHTR